MKKIETIWHHVLFEALTHGTYRFTQKDLAQIYSCSLSTVHHALIVPARIGAIRKESKFFVLADFLKLLLYWASVRNLTGSIMYQTYSSFLVNEMEGLVLPSSVYACYSAARRILGEPPADYDSVYVYDAPENLPEIRRRYPAADKKRPNFFVLRGSSILHTYASVTTIPQTYVDIWNLSDWYAKDFIKTLEEKIHGILS